MQPAEEAHAPQVPSGEPTGDEGFYEVEAIVKHRYKQGWRFLTVWKGWSLEDATWEPVRSFVHPDGGVTEKFKVYCRDRNLEAPLRQAVALVSNLPAAQAVRLVTRWCL
jgi:hypothetical protein